MLSRGLSATLTAASAAVVAACGLAVCAAAPQQPADAAGRALLDRIVAARGGQAALDRVRSIRAVAHAPVTSPAGRTADIVSTTYIEYPNRVRIETTLPDATIVQVFDGRRAWVSDPDGVHDVPEDRLGDIEAMLARDPIALLVAAERGTVHVRRLSDVTDDDGRREQALECSGQPLGTVILYADAASGAVRKEAYTLGPAGSPLVEEHYADYRNVQGVQVAFTVQVTRAGQAIVERRLTDFTINPPDDPARFARPGP
jgi:outer membrane lipoprotein-sorting protein